MQSRKLNKGHFFHPVLCDGKRVGARGFYMHDVPMRQRSWATHRPRSLSTPTGFPRKIHFCESQTHFSKSQTHG